MSIRLIADVVNQLGSPALYSNSLANRPPAGFGGRLFISSDTHEIYQDVITGWNLIADAGAGAGTLDSVTHNGNTTTWGINILGGDLTLQATQKLYVLGLSNGGVLFPSGGTGLISQDNTNFVWDNTNKYLGIGTNAPTAPFDIHSGSNVMQQLNSTGTNNSFLAFLNQDIGKWRIGNLYGGGNNDMVIYDTANGTYRAYFTNTGYTILPNSVIIGSSSRSSSYTLDVTGTGRFSGNAFSNSAFIVSANGSNTIGAGAFISLQTVTGTNYQNNIQLNASGGLDFWTYNVTDGWIKRTTFANNGSATFSSSVATGGWIMPNGVNALTADSSHTYLQQPSGGDILLRKSDGTTFVTIANTGAATFSSLGTGTVTATSGTLSTVSDMNLKDEDGFIDNALEKVLKLKPRYFHWKKESGLPTDLRQLGFYAQEVNEAIGEEGANTPKGENDKWGIYDRAIIAMLTKAIQEQQYTITSLQDRINNIN